MQFANIPSIEPVDYAQKISRSLMENRPGDYFIITDRDTGTSGNTYEDVALVYRKRSSWFPKLVAKISKAVPRNGMMGGVTIRVYDKTLDSKKLEIMIGNMRSISKVARHPDTKA